MAGRIGGMDQRITFQSEVLTDDGQGGRESSGWANIATAPTMWAKVVASRGAESEEGERRPANVYPIDVTIRNREDISELMIVLWRGRSYNIRSIDPYNPRAEFRKLLCEGGVPL
jgi:SPP1 family predicted phage head-tail adaptor